MIQLLRQASRDSSEPFALQWEGEQLEVPAAIGAGRCAAGRSTCCLSFEEHVEMLFRIWATNEATNVGLDHHAGSKETDPVNPHFASQASLCRHDVLTYAEMVRLEDLAPSSFETLNTKMGNAVEQLSHAGRTVMRPQLLHASEVRPMDPDEPPGMDMQQRAEDLLSKLLLVFGDDFATLGHLYDSGANRQRYTSQMLELLVYEGSVDTPPASPSSPPSKERL